MAPIITRILRDGWETAKEESDSWELKRPSVISNIERTIKCRTLWLGIKEFRCENNKCNYKIFVPNTCKSRICSSCGFKATLNWQGAFMHRVIPSEYQHLVFSCPPLLTELFKYDRRAVINLMYRAASKSILEFCRNREGYLPGLTGVFQSFGKSLNLHPHFHIIRTSGGIQLDDGKTWISSSYLPEESIKARYKAKILKGLRGLHRKGKLKGYYGKMNYKDFNKRLDRIHQTHWWVWIGHADDYQDLIPYFYITRYLSRAPISSRRIVDYAKGRYVKWLPQCKHKLHKTQAFVDTPTAFIEKLAVHIPDRCDHLIFYSGLYAPAYRKTYYKEAKEHFKKQGIDPVEGLKEHIPMDWAKLKEMVSGVNPLTCPCCGGKMVFVDIFFFKKEDIDLLELKDYRLVVRGHDTS